MANKTQAKAAVDAAATAIKADIDATLPTGVNIVDGRVDFNPTRWYFKLGPPDKATADSWASTMMANLTAAGKFPTIRREGNYVNDEVENVITILAPPGVYQLMWV